MGFKTPLFEAGTAPFNLPFAHILQFFSDPLV